MSLPPRVSSVLHSRAALALGIAGSLLVPALTMPRLPDVSAWPVLVALVPWVIGKYVLCPLRWHALTDAGLSRSWHVRAYAESELLGLLTPGHVGADVWRIHRLERADLRRPDAVMSVGLDRTVGALGLAAFVACASATLPLRMLVVALGVGVVLAVLAAVLRWRRPDLMPQAPLPRPRRLLLGLALSVAYQLSIAALLFGAVVATGHTLSPLALLGAFGASQIAGAIPGPHGASPRDAALAVALAALGLPWSAALAAVSLKAVVAWLPALTLGGMSLLVHRRALASAAAH